MKVQSADAKPKTYHSLTDHYSYPLLDIGSCAQRLIALGPSACVVGQRKSLLY